jgi:ankyrin repeat protein
MNDERCIAELQLALKKNPLLARRSDSVFATSLRCSLAAATRLKIFGLIYSAREPSAAVTSEMLVQLPISELSSYRLNFDASDGLGRTVLMNVVTDFRSTYEIIDLVISRVVKINAQDFYGRTALLHVVSQGVSPNLSLIQVVKRLVAAGADQFITDCSGETALSIAQLNDSPALVELFKQL